MEFLGTRPSASAKALQNSSAQVSRGYASNALQSKAGQHSTRHTTLSMYSELPVGDISLEDFEQLALDRLRVLKGVEEVKLRNKSDAEVQARARELVDRHLKGNDNEDTARRDQLSHFILRLAYCRTPELRKWLLLQAGAGLTARGGGQG
ncbi:uncharacterized protein HaLaN_19866 [Haematococcus lacustris]|uniref:Uncharacterized protein n=1 Tax=Haematococcus lacustris TaxID=44745 RepID=A0A699ZUK8_HAELA|nr:uncharacterized protein HaLaN_19866 [Haematococcus lacustris]